jgi:hypothetical protein
MAKYNSMEEILALFPDDKPVLINFYDANTEAAIKDDIFRAKQLLQDRATVVSIKQQDYPELAKLVRTILRIYIRRHASHIETFPFLRHHCPPSFFPSSVLFGFGGYFFKNTVGLCR